mmetsp:Transcript_8228/g.17232  ORF Transcript_8228/g.17232 Transcript_8228/m.17232 type:complete len:107 (+) Transcript_8228:1884-2204(+)
MMLVFSSGGSKTDTFEIVKWIICERKRGQRRNYRIIMNTFRVLEKILNQKSYRMCWYSLLRKNASKTAVHIFSEIIVVRFALSRIRPHKSIQNEHCNNNEMKLESQ